jgi:hypothetical protein
MIQQNDIKNTAEYLDYSANFLKKYDAMVIVDNGVA